MEDQPPEEPPKKGPFYGKWKRGRSLSRYQSKGNKKSTSRPSSDSPPPAPGPQERDRDVPEHRHIASRLHSKGQRGYITNKDLSSALKRANKEIGDQRLLLDASEKKQALLSTKNKSLIEGVKESRAQSRSYKSAASKAEAEAREASTQLEVLCHQHTTEISHLQSSMATQELQHQEEMAAAVLKEVSLAKEKAKVRRFSCFLRRSVSVVEVRKSLEIGLVDVRIRRELRDAAFNGLICPLNPAACIVHFMFLLSCAPAKLCVVVLLLLGSKIQTCGSY
jgi:hypothetical protein